MTNPPPNPLADREQRLALFQMWFLRHHSPTARRWASRSSMRGAASASMRLEWREELVGIPRPACWPGGPLTALLDGCCGMSVGDLAQGAQALRHARPPHRLCEARDARPGG